MIDFSTTKAFHCSTHYHTTTTCVYYYAAHIACERWAAFVQFVLVRRSHCAYRPQRWPPLIVTDSNRSTIYLLSSSSLIVTIAHGCRMSTTELSHCRCPHPVSETNYCATSSLQRFREFSAAVWSFILSAVPFPPLCSVREVNFVNIGRFNRSCYLLTCFIAYILVRVRLLAVMNGSVTITTQSSTNTWAYPLTNQALNLMLTLILTLNY